MCILRVLRYVHRNLTSAFEYDAIKRQGVENMIDKMIKLGSESVQRRSLQYIAHGQLWMRQLAGLVGDEAWAALGAIERLELASMRGELEFFRNTPDPLTPLGAGGGRTDPMRWNLPTISSKVMADKLLAVFQNRRELREAQQCAVGAAEVISLDWTVQSGKTLGGKHLANVCNEDNNLVASRVTKSERIEEVSSFLEEIGARPNVSARVVVIDKVPPSLDESAVSKLAEKIMDAIPSVEKVMQDRFHVGHHISKHFNNADARFYALVIHGWRDATVTRDSKFENAVDEALRAGLISKQRNRKGITLGQRLSDDEISKLKASGEYHNLFSAKECIVPEHVKDADTLRLSVARWKTMVIDACFHPPGADGKRLPILLNGSNLVSSIEMMERIADKALKRIVHCIPPPGIRAWRPTGRTDTNGFEIQQSLLHTCGVESVNGQQSDFVTGSRCSKEVATACFLEGNAARIVAKAVASGEQEDVGTSDVRCALSINRWAGHGDDAGMVRLMHIAPHAIRSPPPKPDAAVCIQPLGRLDARVTQQLPSTAELARMPNVPRVLASLPAKTLMALPPPLTALAQRNAASLMLRMDDAASDDDFDVSQLDSPESRRQLAQAGVSLDDSPSVIRRAWDFLFGNSPTAAAAEPAPPPPPALTPAPPPIVPPPIPTSSEVSLAQAPPAEPLVLAQAPPAKRQKVGSTSAYQAKKKCMQNQWWCVCRPAWPAQGRQWHVESCPREKWAQAYDRDPSTAAAPAIGARVTALQCAGPRAGRSWEYRGGNEGVKGWVEVV